MTYISNTFYLKIPAEFFSEIDELILKFIQEFIAPKIVKSLVMKDSYFMISALSKKSCKSSRQCVTGIRIGIKISGLELKSPEINSHINS